MSKNSLTPSQIVSRRDFLAMLAAGAAVCALRPESAFALESAADSQKTADQLWAEAVAQAKAEGSPVYENIPANPGVVPRSSVSGSNTKAGVAVGGVVDVITAVAVYQVTSAGKIDTVNSAWVHGTQSTATNCYYSYTKIDGKRTLAISFTVTLQNIFGFNQSLKVYSEYGVSGGNGLITVTYL